MKHPARDWTILLFAFVVSNSTIPAQPFDTLLQQFSSIEEIYPLEDSTFILIGTGKEILVERIDRKAKSRWSVPIVSSARDYLYEYRFDISNPDSIVQIATVDKFCDAYGRSLFKTFTLSLSGELIDSQKVNFGIDNGFIFLLSGLPGRPRLAYFENKEVVI